MQPVRTVSVSVDRPAAEVYAYVRDPRNLPAWAPGFARSVRHDGDAWLVETAGGPVRIAFAPDNPYGVLDHEVTTADGVVTLNPMRVLASGGGCVVLFTLLDGSVDDEVVVRADLERLHSRSAGA